MLEKFLSNRGLKSTRQRALIVEAFFSDDGHHTVEEVWTRVRQRSPKVSVATVYRTMRLLVESGLAHAQNFGDGQARFEAAAGREHHDHLICTGCGHIIEFENDRIESMQEAVARKHGFRVASHKMEIYGTCRECQRQGVSGPPA